MSLLQASCFLEKPEKPDDKGDEYEEEREQVYEDDVGSWEDFPSGVQVFVGQIINRSDWFCSLFARLSLSIG